MPQNNKHEMSTGAKAGLGLAALAAAAAGAYYFYGSKEGAKRRKALTSWAVKARGEVMEKLEKIKSIDRETYDQIVDQVMTRYRGMKNISVAEVLALGKELKSHWSNIMKDVQKSDTNKKPALKKGRSRSKTAK